jgi:hypothetical protein
LVYIIKHAKVNDEKGCPPSIYTDQYAKIVKINEKIYLHPKKHSDLYHIDKVNNQSLSETRLFSYIGDYLPSPPKTTLVKRYLDIRSPCTHSGYE